VLTIRPLQATVSCAVCIVLCLSLPMSTHHSAVDALYYVHGQGNQIPMARVEP
jgi:hypothetical protein